MIRTEKISVAVAGAAGSAVGAETTKQALNGKLRAVYLDFTDQPATCDVTIETLVPPKVLLTATNVNTDGWFYPRYIVHSEAGAALTGLTGGDRDTHPLDAPIKVSVAQGDPGTVDAYVVYER